MLKFSSNVHKFKKGKLITSCVSWSESTASPLLQRYWEKSAYCIALHFMSQKVWQLSNASCGRYVKFLSNFKFNVIYYRGLAANGMERQNNHFYRGKKEILPSISSSPPSLMFLAQAMYFISTFYNSTSYIARNPIIVK